jgi:hypothetical protein
MAKKRKPAQFTSFMSAILTESDRGCVLTCAAGLEDELRDNIKLAIQILQRNMRMSIVRKEHKKRVDIILDGALGRAGSRIAFCQAIGIIDAKTASSLNQLFQIRNQHFAHFAGVSQLTDRGIKDQLDAFIGSVKLPKWYLEFRLSDDSPEHPQIRRDFIDAAFLLHLRISDQSRVFSNILTQSKNPNPRGGQRTRKQHKH